MYPLFSKSGRLIGVVTCFCLLLIFLIWNQLVRQLDRDRKETISKAVQRNANLAVTLEQYAISTIKQADQVLKVVKMEYENKGAQFKFEPLITDHIIDVNQWGGIGIFNEKGSLQLCNLGAFKNAQQDFSDREHFAFHKTHTDELFISKPLMSRTIMKEVLVLSRRINKPDGSFGGTVALQIEPATFTRFYSNASLSANEIISLIAPDGITYARRLGNKESSGEDIHKSPLFFYLAKNRVGNYEAKDAIHGIPSFFSFRRLEEYPVIATAGSAKDDVLASYYKRAQRDYIFGAIITFLLVLFFALMSMAFIYRRQNHRTIKDSEARHRSIFENSYDGIILLSPNGYIEAINKGANSMFKVEEFSGEKARFNHLYQSSSPALSIGQEHFSLNDESEKEILFTRLDNTEFIGEIAYSHFIDSAEKLHLVINIRDITARKQMEQRLLKEQKRFQRKLTKQIILAQERERELIGHELHDNVNQILATVKLYLEMGLSHPETRDELLPKSILHVMSCITEIRNLSHALSAPTLGTQSLIDSISALIETVESSSRLRITFIHDNYKTSIIKDQKLAIYRILQEQLNNIIKHAEATDVSIILAQQDDQTEIQISDNGKGFDMHTKGSGIGFNNILSRTKVFGGQLKINAELGKGCTLYITMPIIKKETVQKPALSIKTVPESDF